MFYNELCSLFQKPQFLQRIVHRVAGSHFETFLAPGEASGGAKPSRAEPGRDGPSRAEPSRAGPSRAMLRRAEPSRAEPSRAEPIRAEPCQTEFSRAEQEATHTSHCSKRQVCFHHELYFSHQNIHINTIWFGQGNLRTDYKWSPRGSKDQYRTRGAW